MHLIEDIRFGISILTLMIVAAIFNTVASIRFAQREQMVSIADIDAELTTIEGEDAALATSVTQVITDLEAKAAGSGIDFTPELTRLKNIATAITTVTSTAAAADPGSTAAGGAGTPAS